MKIVNLLRTPFLLLAIGSPAFVAAQDKLLPPTTENKSSYHLFNPTPDQLMRDMSTDRPDTTESPYTVDAGHIQLEMSMIDFRRNDDSGAKTSTLDVMPMNLKFGLLNNIDIQFLFTPQQYVETKEDSNKDTTNGFGDDTQIRLKVNFWGNDSGETAFAFMPFIKFPTGSGDLSNDHVEGGLIFPLAISLPAGWDMGLMAETDFAYNEEEDSYGTDFVHTATFAHDIPLIENLGGYLEYVGISPHDTGSTYQATFSTGLTYGLTKDIQLDGGGTYGLNGEADDFGAFLGASFRY